jgi:flagellar hook assembly protein FlgD
MDGDVVKIFNVNGKKIREITSGDSSGFKWDGKKDDGSYAVSGAYIYQIKVASKSSLISGTIAFVR